jgi:hypothetical protein
MSVPPSSLAALKSGGEATSSEVGLQSSAQGMSTAPWRPTENAPQTLSDPVHVEAAKVLRHSRIHVDRPPIETEVPVRDLGDYDAVFGVDLGGGAA